MASIVILTPLMLTFFQKISVDVILLDLVPPDIDGMDLLSIIRKRMTTSLIVISARNSESEKVKALDLGENDYVTKPFGTNELLARIRTALRHRSSVDHGFIGHHQQGADT